MGTSVTGGPFADLGDPLSGASRRRTLHLGRRTCAFPSNLRSLAGRRCIRLPKAQRSGRWPSSVLPMTSPLPSEIALESAPVQAGGAEFLGHPRGLWLLFAT